jgi:hypothetical protein
MTERSMLSRATRLGVGLLCLLSAVTGPTVMAAQKGTSAMNSKNDCGKNALELSRCMIEAILADLSATYTHVGGGGITDIKMIATNTFTVSLSQEERVDLITYGLRLKADGGIEIVSRSKDTKSQGR